MKKIIYILFFALMASLAQAQSNAQFGDWEIVCWDSAGVVAPLQVRVSSGNTSGNLIRTYYRFAGGSLAKVVPGTGTIGACSAAELQDIIIHLSQVLIDNDTIINNLTQQLIDNDTVINLLNVIANAAAPNSHIVSELGCLMLYDTTEGCDVVGLTTTLSGIPPGWSSVFLNGTLIFGSRVQGCSDMVAALNAPVFDVPGTWSCCNDSLVVNSLDTSLFWRLDFVSHTTGDTITKFFNDTTEAGVVAELKIPVEIIKLVDSTGEILTLRYFSADGATEYTGRGELTVGACPDAAETQFQDYISQQVSVLVEQGNCLLQNKWKAERITTTTVYAANTYNSISISAKSGTVTVNTGTGAVTLDTDEEFWAGADGCNFMDTAVTVTITGGAANVLTYY